eukprot:CAMPEP_0115336702 /NCGR_PEP_ID=MMETSP0270-20121206/89142_1 /TAXON_ID=71861 /ORGANISM="Scrippsiella trochoidea, Strain CCMP3099" /LENGTH=32 /DNA_ID= /DNA_START= /DNA_END= /DNA_ORIENTATION=
MPKKMLTVMPAANVTLCQVYMLLLKPRMTPMA